MIEEPAGSRDRRVVSVDQTHAPHHPAIAFLDHPHNGSASTDWDGRTTPFHGTTSCGNHATLTVLAAGSTGSNPGTPIPSPTASATPAPSASPSTSAEAPSVTSGTTSGTSGASSQPAKNGSSGTSTIAAAAGAFLLAGAGALGVVALRRHRTRA